MKRTRIIVAIVVLSLLASFQPAFAQENQDPGSGCRDWYWGPMSGWNCVANGIDCNC